MKKIIRLKESDLTRIVKRVIKESGDTHTGMKEIATQLEPYGYKHYTVGENSVWKGGEDDGSGVVYYSSENKFKVYVNGNFNKEFEVTSSNNYDSSSIVKSVVSILKKY